LEWDAENSYLALDHSDEDPMDKLRGHSITYRIAVGPQQGRKVFTLPKRPDLDALLLQLASAQQREPDDAEFLHWLQVALETVRSPHLAEVFDDACYTQAFNEVPVQYLDNGRLVHGIIDRLVVTVDTAMLVDYKTHSNAGATSIPGLVEHYPGRRTTVARPPGQDLPVIHRLQ